MGLYKSLKLWAARRRYGVERETLAYPKLVALMGQNRVLGTPKPTPTNLRYFSRTVYARRAINAIKDPICALDWEVVPIETTGKAALSDCETLTRCLERPNHTDSMRSLLAQLIEDALVSGAGVLEQATSNDQIRPLWLWPVDATTIRPLATWDGRPESVRFYQNLGYTGGSIMADINAKKLLAKDIVYLRMNPSSESPFGYGPLEIAYDTISWKLGAGRYAANVASNAQPANLIYAGEAASQAQIDTLRAYWRNEVEGQGQTPIIAGPVKAEVQKLHAGGDEALYLKWQEFLIREIATAFSLSPQNLSIERDVNRNTSEVAEDRDWDAAIVPMATLIESHITTDVLHARLGLHNLRFQFIGLDRQDEEATANIYDKNYRNNLITPNEQREKLGMPPLKSPWADLTWADVQIAMKAAQGAKQVDDPALPRNPGDPNQ